jgi:hypothetical protein
MLYSRDGKIATREGKVLERKVNTLTFQVQGTQFPDPSGTVKGNFRIVFNSSQSILINFGDGDVISYQSKTSENDVSIVTENPTLDEYGPHIYKDTNTGFRFLTIEFQDLTELTEISFFFCQLSGIFPVEINAAQNLRSLFLQSTNFLETFPASIAENKNISSLGLGQAFKDRLSQIPDAFFSMNLEEFIIGNALILTDLISSNFFKINQLKDTLKRFVIRNNFVEFLPESIKECQLLENLDMYDNIFKEFPKQIPFLSSLKVLRMGKGVLEDSSIPVMYNEKLEDFDVRFENLNFSDIPISFSNLFSLRVINEFNQLVINNLRFDEFINQFYTLIVNNAYLDPSTAPLEETYPNKFRNITWGHSSLTPSGIIQAPIIDGSPQNQGEKIYELVNKYGHIITTA